MSEGIFLRESQDSFVFSVPNAEKTLEALNRFLVADEVELDILPSFCAVFSAPRSKINVWESEVKSEIPKAKDKVFVAQEFPWGFVIPRGLLSSSHVEYWVKEGQSLPFAIQEISDSDYTKARIDAGVPEWGVDYTDDSLPLEFPMFHEISYNKGCYIGQETIARATYRGHMNRSFARFESVDGSPLQLALVFQKTDATETAVGKLTTTLDSRGLGLLRISAHEGELYQLSGQLSGQLNGATRVTLKKPELLVENEAK